MLLRSLFLFVLLFPSVLSAQQRPITPADKAAWRIPSSPVISTKTNDVVFTVREADTAANRWITQIHLLRESGEIRQLTQGAVSCTAPAWSPDGSMITFLSARPGVDAKGKQSSGTRSLYGMPAGGGEAALLAAAPADIAEYTWSPDGSSIALLTEGELPGDWPQELKRREARKLNITVSGDPKPGQSLWLYNVASSSLQIIAKLDAGAAGFRWFPDGKRLVYQTNYTGEYNDEQKFDLWMIDLSGDATQLTDAAGPESAPRVSPDGRTVAFISQTVPDIEFAKTEISLLNMETRAVRRLTADAVHSVEDMHWLPDGSLMALFNVGTSAGIHIVDAGSGTTRSVTDPGLVAAELKVSASGHAVFLADGPGMLREVYILSRDGSARRTHFSDQLKPFMLGDQRVISVRSDDGLYDIEAVLVTPKGIKPGTRVPLLLAYHGGPYGDFDNRMMQSYPAHILAAQGIATVMPNVRGSSGYSDEFGQANRRDLGGGDFRDAMHIVDHLITTGIADSSRMAVIGGSYGGYLTNWTISQTRRFKAAVSMFGIFSWLTDWSNSWQPDFEVMFLGHNYWEKPLDMNNLWISRAPQTFVRNISTPTLILQGDVDEYTNITNSREMYQALRTLGCETEFVVYKGAGHGLRNNPNQWIDSMERSVRWITDRIGPR